MVFGLPKVDFDQIKNLVGFYHIEKMKKTVDSDRTICLLAISAENSENVVFRKTFLIIYI